MLEELCYVHTTLFLATVNCKSIDLQDISAYLNQLAFSDSLHSNRKVSDTI